MPDAVRSTRRRAPFVLGALRRRWVTILATTVLVAVLTAGYLFAHGRSYTAATSVLIRPLNGNAFTSASLTNNQVTTVAVQTEANLVASAAVTRLVNQDLGTHLAANASVVVTATVPPNSQLIVIQATAATYPRARDYARAYAKAFLTYRASLATADQKAQVDQLTTQLSTAHTALENAAAIAHEKNPPPDAAVNLQLASGALSQVQNAINQAQAIPTAPGSVVKPAHPVAGGLSSNRSLLLGGGVVAGLILGLLIAAWREIRDERVRASAEGVVDDLPVVGVLPRLDAAAPTGAHADQVRRARTNVLAGTRPPCVLAIAPATVDEAGGGADAAIQLARSLHSAGYRVCLVDAAIVAPRIGALLGIGRGLGLSDALDDAAPAPATSEVDGVHVLAAGTGPEAARERYGGAAMTTILERLRAESDYVVIVTPPVDGSDGLAVVRVVDAVVLAVGDGRTTRTQVRDAHASTQYLGVDLIGVLAVAEADVPSGAVLTLPRSATPATGPRSEPAAPTVEDVPVGRRS